MNTGKTLFAQLMDFLQGAKFGGRETIPNPLLSG